MQFNKKLILVALILVLNIELIESKKWEDFYKCQQKCREEKECDGKCAKDFNQKCNIFKEGLVGEEEECEWVKDFWNDLEDELPEDDEKISDEYGEKWIICYGHCINSLEDGYAVAYAECYQSCDSNKLKNSIISVVVIIGVMLSLLFI